MEKFKVGDKVEVVEAYDNYKVGEVGNITSINGIYYRINGDACGVLARHFKKVNDLYEDQWHLNDGKVTIPDDADKLEKDGSVVAFRKRKAKPFEFGDKVKYADGTIYIFVRNTEHGWCYGIKETHQCCTTLQLDKLTKI
jgi:hypothetical protein